MPLYEFECTICHHQFEELMSSSSKETPPCPSCKATQTQKKVSAGAIRAGSFAIGGGASVAPSCSPTG